MTTKNSVLSDPMCGIIRFITIDLSMSEEDSLKKQVTRDIVFLHPRRGSLSSPRGISSCSRA